MRTKGRSEIKQTILNLMLNFKNLLMHLNGCIFFVHILRNGGELGE